MTNHSSLRILHVITDLRIGGAETMLSRLLPRLRDMNVESEVVCLSARGPLSETLESEGFRVTHLNMKPGRFSLCALFTLSRIIRAFRPTLIHSWLYHADLMASLASYFCRVPLIWSIHNSEFRPDVKRSTLIVVGILSRLSSRVPRKILSCSRTATAIHIQRGYRADRIVYLPNGFDTDRFAPDDTLRTRMRKEIGVRDDDVVIGNVARLDPQKNQSALIRAFGAIANDFPNAVLVLAGRGIDSGNEPFQKLISEMGIEGRVRLLGERRDIPALLNAFDIFVLPSISEAFPLALGEAMSCGRYCIAADVGDCAEVIQTSGKILSSHDELPNALRETLSLKPEERMAIGAVARARIIRVFSLDTMTNQLVSLYESVR